LARRPTVFLFYSLPLFSAAIMSAQHFRFTQLGANTKTNTNTGAEPALTYCAWSTWIGI